MSILIYNYINYIFNTNKYKYFNFWISNKYNFNLSIEFTLTDLAFINIFQGINIPIPCRTKIKYTIFHLEQ